MAMKEGGLFVPARPQISIEIDEHDDIFITVASISDDFKRIKINSIEFPIGCAREVAKYLLELAGGQ